MKKYKTLKEAKNALHIDAGFDPFLHGGAKGSDGKIYKRPTLAALAALGYVVENTGVSKDMILRRIPEDVHRAFKVKCASEGKGMSEKLIEYMREVVAG